MVPITVPLVVAMLEGRRADAEALLDATMPSAWPGPALVERAFYAQLDAIRENPDHRLWGDRVALTRESPQRVIGSVVFHGGPDGEGVVEVAYGVELESQGQGYGTEMVGAAVQWALSEPTVRSVRATTFTLHTISRRILEKLGFVVIGTREDYLGELLEFELARGKGPSAHAVAAA